VQKQLRMAVMVSIVSALLVHVFGVAYAKSIVVDGLPDDWQTSDRVYADPNEADTQDAVPDAVDIASVYFTYDTAQAYFRLDTYAATDWDEVGFIALCFDSTADLNAPLGPCVGDYTLRLEPRFAAVELFDNDTGEVVPGVEIAVASHLTVTEIALPLAVVLPTAEVCQAGCEIRASLIVDASRVFLSGDDPSPLNNFDWAPDSGASGGSFIARLGTRLFFPIIRLWSSLTSGQTNPALTPPIDLRLTVTTLASRR
jgi:hypothetical protein